MDITEDEQFMATAVEEAARSSLDAGRASPLVGAVAVRDGAILGVAHRGETGAGDHAEYALLVRKLAGADLRGATVYTTLEPCTKRNHPKVPCAERLVGAGVTRVVTGMLDPNPVISGKGLRLLRHHGIEISLFAPKLMAQVEHMNRAFSSQFPPEAAAIMQQPLGRPLARARLWLNDSYFLGMNWRTRRGAIGETSVGSYQCDVTNLSHEPVRLLRGILTSETDPFSVDVHLNRGGRVVPATCMRELRPGKLARLAAPFPSSGQLAMADTEFLARYTPFRVRLETEYGAEDVLYSREDCEQLIARLQGPRLEEGVEWGDDPACS